MDMIYSITQYMLLNGEKFFSLSNHRVVHSYVVSRPDPGA